MKNESNDDFKNGIVKASLVLVLAIPVILLIFAIIVIAALSSYDPTP